MCLATLCFAGTMEAMPDNGLQTTDNGGRLTVKLGLMFKVGGSQIRLRRNYGIMEATPRQLAMR
jgi:hypothetical protein